jgi:hypothetical protein
MESDVANGFFLAKFKRNTMDTCNNLENKKMMNLGRRLLRRFLL